MSPIKFKGLGLVIIGVVLMTTLLSCTKMNETEKFNKELIKLNIETSLNTMQTNINAVAVNIQSEQDYFKDRSTDFDYDYFASQLEKSFEAIEMDFAIAHNDVLEGLTTLKLHYTKSEQLEAIQDIEDQQLKMSTLFKDLNAYHYMILEVNVILDLFTSEVANLITFMADGNLTTLEYNTELELIMTRYSDLLVLNNEDLFTDQFLKDSTEIESTLKSLQLAKNEISTIATLTPIDVQVNEQVYNMFNYIEKSIQTVYDYTLSIDVHVYSDDLSLRIDEGAVNYVSDILLRMNNDN